MAAGTEAAGSRRAAARVDERAVVFACGDERLLGVLHEAGGASPHFGVLVVVGGPQYRVGSHRQFVLLGRALAAGGFPVLRFDYRGMGDAEGPPRTFEDVGADIGAALDVLQSEVPSLQGIVLWGLCDAASAALLYAHTDRRVAGLVLLNPWVRTEAGAARAYVKHYYLARLTSRALWQRVWRGEFDYRASLRSFGEHLATTLSGHSASKIPPRAERGEEGGLSAGELRRPLPERMADGLERFRGRTLLLLSGRDLTADEFRDVVRASRRWRGLVEVSTVTTRQLAEADHTFSSARWRNWVEQETLQWLRTSI